MKVDLRLAWMNERFRDYLGLPNMNGRVGVPVEESRPHSGGAWSCGGAGGMRANRERHGERERESARDLYWALLCLWLWGLGA